MRQNFLAKPKYPGGENIKQKGALDSSWRPMIPHRLLVAAALGLCLAVAGIPALGADTFDGVYSGKGVLKKGSADPSCPTEEDVSVTIHGETLTFTDSTLKKFTMPFYPGSDGSFGQTHTDEGGGVLYYYGRIIGNVLDADITNPPCEHHWQLKKE